MNVRDEGGAFPPNNAFIHDVDTKSRLTELMDASSDEHKSLELDMTLRCMGNGECVRSLMFPTATQQQRERCDKTVSSKIGYSFDEEKYREYEERDIRKAYSYREEYAKPYIACMSAVTTTGLEYFSSLSPSDWIHCYGDVTCIRLRRKQVLYCHPDNIPCMEEVSFPGSSRSPEGNAHVCIDAVNKYIRFPELYKSELSKEESTLREYFKKFSLRSVDMDLDRLSWTKTDHIKTERSLGMDSIQHMTRDDVKDRRYVIAHLDTMESGGEPSPFALHYMCMESNAKMNLYDNFTEKDWKECDGDVRCFYKKTGLKLDYYYHHPDE